MRIDGCRTCHLPLAVVIRNQEAKAGGPEFWALGGEVTGDDLVAELVQGAVAIRLEIPVHEIGCDAHSRYSELGGVLGQLSGAHLGDKIA